MKSSPVSTAPVPVEPQAVTQPALRYAIFLVLVVTGEPDAVQQVRDWCGDVAAVTRAVGHRRPEADLSCVCGFGHTAWTRLFGNPAPADLHPFREIGAAGRLAPGTPGDILLHIRAQDMDLCFELASRLRGALGGAVATVDEVHGFRYFDMRSIIGFVDGTENPAGREAAQFTLVGDEDPGFAGGSYVLVQKYLHDIAGWNALPVETQERFIGRAKLSDIELAPDVKPSNSHSSLTTLEDAEGNEVKILRDNMPFGRPGSDEFGTYFIGYARSPAPIEQMLENMIVGRPPGNYDRLLDFSRAVTGCLFFVPSADLLEALAERDPAVAPGDDAPPGEVPATPPTEPAPVVRTADGSLNIGSLKGVPNREQPAS